MTIHLGIVGIVGVAVVGGLWHLSGDSAESAESMTVQQQQPTQTAPSPSSNALLAREVRHLRNRVDELSNRAEKSDAVAQASASAPRDDQEPADQDDEAVFVDAARSLDEAMVNESRDPTWAGQTEARIYEALQADDVNAAVVSASCAATVCRLEATVGDRNAADELVGQLTAKEPFATTGFAHLPRDEGDEHQRVILFFAREGHQLPI